MSHYIVSGKAVPIAERFASVHCFEHCEVLVHSLPPEIWKFVDEKIASVDRLEILRVVLEHPNREFRIDDFSKETQATPDQVMADLTALKSLGLLTTEMQSDGLAVRYAPGTDDIAKHARQTIEFYRERPVSMIRFVYERANARLRAFSDAFKFRTED